MTRASSPHAGLRWRKSSYSGPDGGNCVEVAYAVGAVHVRDSKERRGPVLSVAPASWAAFLTFADEAQTQA